MSDKTENHLAFDAKNQCPLQWLKSSPRADILAALQLAQAMAQDAISDAQVRSLANEQYGSELARKRAHHNLDRRRSTLSVLKAFHKLIIDKKI